MQMDNEFFGVVNVLKTVRSNINPSAHSSAIFHSHVVCVKGTEGQVCVLLGYS